jgi:hypothetical protein
MSSIDTLSLRIPIRSSTLIGLDFPLTTLIGIVGKRKQLLTYTQETTRAKLERLRSASLSKVTKRSHLNLQRLLSLGIPYVLYASVQFKCLFNRAQLTQALIDTGGGYHLEAPNIKSDHSPSFTSSILHFPLITPPGLQLCQPFNHFTKPHRTSID